MYKSSQNYPVVLDSNLNQAFSYQIGAPNLALFQLLSNKVYGQAAILKQNQHIQEALALGASLKGCIKYGELSTANLMQYKAILLQRETAAYFLPPFATTNQASAEEIVEVLSLVPNPTAYLQKNFLSIQALFLGRDLLLNEQSADAFISGVLHQPGEYSSSQNSVCRSLIEASLKMGAHIPTDLYAVDVRLVYDNRDLLINAESVGTLAVGPFNKGEKEWAMLRELVEVFLAKNGNLTHLVKHMMPWLDAPKALRDILLTKDTSSAFLHKVATAFIGQEDADLQLSLAQDAINMGADVHYRIDKNTAIDGAWNPPLYELLKSLGAKCNTYDYDTWVESGLSDLLVNPQKIIAIKYKNIGATPSESPKIFFHIMQRVCNLYLR